MESFAAEIEHLHSIIEDKQEVIGRLVVLLSEHVNDAKLKNLLEKNGIDVMVDTKNTRS